MNLRGVYRVIGVAFTISLTVLFTSTNATISCYHCSSRNWSDPSCHDPYDPAYSKYITNCMVPKKGHVGRFPANFCLKVAGKTATTGEEIVIRACILYTMDSQCGVFRFEDEQLNGCILTCDYDGCNGASTNNPKLNFYSSFIMIILFSAMSILCMLKLIVNY